MASAGNGAPSLQGRPGAAACLDIKISQKVDVERVIALAVAAGDAIMGVYNQPESEWGVESKADDTPLTLADSRANDIICSGLARIAPHIPIVSEESQQADFAVRRSYQCCWMVDPLDGTREFLRHNGQFTVNIALLAGGRPVLGVVQVPVTGVVYYAVQGHGAWRRERAGGGGSVPHDVRLRALQYDATQEGMTVVASSTAQSPELRAFLSDLRAPVLDDVASSLRLVRVAEGAAHVFPRFRPGMKEWDTAAAHAIVLEAGGRVVRTCARGGDGQPLEDWREALARGEELSYNNESLALPDFMVYGRLE